MRIEQIQTLERFLPHLSGSEPEKKAALAAIKALGYGPLATELAAAQQGPGAVQFLQTVATTEHGRNARAAVDALKTIGTSEGNPGLAGSTAAQALHKVAEGTTDAAVKKTASDAVQDLFARARQATLSLGNEFYAGGVLVDDNGTILASTVLVTLPKVLDRGLPLLARSFDGSISPTRTLFRDTDLQIMFLKLDRGKFLPPLKGLQVAEIPVKKGDRVWVMSTLPNTPFRAIAAAIDQLTESHFSLTSDVSLDPASGVFAGSPVVNEQNQLIGVIQDGQHSCIAVTSLRTAIEKGTKAATEVPPTPRS